jgi:hypothetical protein
MGMIGEYARVSAQDFRRCLREPDVASAVVYEELTQERRTDLDKAWHALSHLLERAGMTVDVVMGGELVDGAGDWGYGPPRYLTAEQVAAAGAQLSGLSWERLTDGVALADLDRAEIYPHIWDESDALDYVRPYYEALVAFFTTAAREGDAVLLWIS